MKLRKVPLYILLLTLFQLVNDPNEKVERFPCPIQPSHSNLKITHEIETWLVVRSKKL